jgi:prepilin-type N-terminal cleavage/methylation domain-containing protein
MRRQSGFTLIELLVVVIIIGILACIGMANYISARDRARAAGVKENMHSAQVAAEGYHASTNEYADTVDKMDPFFPSGSFDVGGRAGNRGNNPYTDIYNDTLYSENLSDTAAINAARANTPQPGPGGRGKVGYCRTDNGESYAICGLDGNAVRVSNPTGGTLVLSNQ